MSASYRFGDRQISAAYAWKLFRIWEEHEDADTRSRLPHSRRPNPLEVAAIQLIDRRVINALCQGGDASLLSLAETSAMTNSLVAELAPLGVRVKRVYLQTLIETWTDALLAFLDAKAMQHNDVFQEWWNALCQAVPASATELEAVVGQKEVRTRLLARFMQPHAWDAWTDRIAELIVQAGTIDAAEQPRRSVSYGSEWLAAQITAQHAAQLRSKADEFQARYLRGRARRRDEIWP